VRGQTALIAGEAGVGKSRLVAEISARARGRGRAVMQGRCFEPDRALPYMPLLDLLRTYLGPDPRLPACDRAGHGRESRLLRRHAADRPAAGSMIAIGLWESAADLPAGDDGYDEARLGDMLAGPLVHESYEVSVQVEVSDQGAARIRGI